MVHPHTREGNHMTKAINTGFQFKASMRDLDKKLTKLRFEVKVANAVRKALGKADVDAGGGWTGQRRYRVRVSYRLGENSPHRDLYSAETRYRGYTPKVKREHAAYASVYVRDYIDWDVE